MSRTAPLTIALIFGRACDQMGQKGQYLAKNASFGPNLAVFGPKSNFWGQGVKILVPSYRDSNETPFLCWRHWSARLQLAARGENVLFWPQNLDIWGQKSIFCLVIAIFVDGANDHYTRGYNFPLRTTPKKFPFPNYWSVSGAHPGFCHFRPFPLRWYRLINFGPSSSKLRGTPGPSKEWPTMTIDLVLAGITEKRPILCLAKKCSFFLQKIVFFFLNKTPEIC